MKNETKTLCRVGPKLDWQLQKVTHCLGITRPVIDELIKDGRWMNMTVSAWLKGRLDMERLSDGHGGFLFKCSSEIYRLRIGTDRISFAISSNKGIGRKFNRRDQTRELNKLDGFIVLFTADMPTAETFFISTEYAMVLRDNGLLNTDWEGDADGVRDYIRETIAGSLDV